MKRRLDVGDVVQVFLPMGGYAYGRILNDGVAFYRQVTAESGEPPIGSRDFQFVVTLDSDVLRRREFALVGHDPSASPEEDWSPLRRIQDPITGDTQVYGPHGEIRPATESEIAMRLEPVMSWSFDRLIDRLEGRITEVETPYEVTQRVLRRRREQE